MTGNKETETRQMLNREANSQATSGHARRKSVHTLRLETTLLVRNTHDERRQATCMSTLLCKKNLKTILLTVV